MASPYGETIGEMKLILVSRASDEESRERVRRALLDENHDVLRVYSSETLPDGSKMILADTTIRTGETEEGVKNVCVTETLGYDEHGDVNDAIRSVLPSVYEPFRRIQSLLHPAAGPTALLIDLLASPGSHFFLACVFLLPQDPTPLEHTLFRVLEATMPIVSVGDSTTSLRTQSSSFPSPTRRQLQPTHTVPELVYTLFRSPQERDRLRREAAAGFLSWWSAERANVSCQVDQVDVVAADSFYGSDKSRELQQSDALSSTPLFRALPMPVLDPLHHTMVFSPLTLLRPLLHRMAQWTLDTAVRGGWRCNQYTKVPCTPACMEPAEKRFSSPKTCSLKIAKIPASDWNGPHWTWGGIARGVAGFAAITVIWAGLVWATTI
ncbi:hypothetical protein DACRYDRAFT_22604 [Dacryopinax primogenitus]|uniref:Uncharacterized protein n=1 Tax=Dacryopinax primogenitus (strain DJM 731) TaxID=1858805 RepID=M5FUN9_DACPD|nr:uncharacterized protein DACRYDRAFT_22604 [Dacryopinax primogenitus]EJU01481.1 hypothetical protein DACRYDRAFT_22604 [Dacryopinax primogenitus]